MNARVLAAAFLVVVSGCSTGRNNGATAYSPDCNPNNFSKINNVELVTRYMECGDKEKAKLTAKLGAEDGIPQMADLYLVLLQSDGDIAPGLVYALKYAEEGDEDSIVWVLKIARKYRIKELTGVASEMYLTLFERKVSYMKWLLDDYISYSSENVKYNGRITISYSVKFLEIAKGSLSVDEYNDALLKIKNNSMPSS